MVCGKLFFFISIVLLLGLVGNASAMLVGRWTFDDGTANDSSGNGHHGTLVQGDPNTSVSIVYDADRNSKVLDCENPEGHTINSFVDCGIGAWADIWSQITIAAWTKVRSIHTTNYLMTKGSSYQMTGLPPPDGRFRVYNVWTVDPGTMTLNQDTYSTSSLLDDQWHHVAFTYDSIAEVRKVYFDGVLEAQEPVSGLLVAAPGSAFIIGGRLVTGWNHRGWDGLIDDVRLYDHVLTEVEIRGFAGLSVPYIHQCFDTHTTEKSFYGWDACGAAATVMALAALDRIVPWPFECVGSPNDCNFQPTVGTHNSPYGNYVFKEYMYAGEVWGDELDEVTNDLKSNPAKGAYGYIYNTTSGRNQGSLIQEFLYKHGIRGDGDADWPGGEDVHDAPEYIWDPDPGIDYVKSELAQGRLLIASTMLTDAKHFVLIRGYDPDSDLFIVNDPFGKHPYSNNYDWPYSVWRNWGNYSGNTVAYTWDDMRNDGNCLNSTISIAGYKDLDNNSPPEPNSAELEQLNVNGEPIPIGGRTTSGTITFEGRIKDSADSVKGLDSVKLEIELIRFLGLAPIGGGKWNYVTDFTPDWSETDVNIPVRGLPLGRYRWRAKTVDIRGVDSNWVSTGDNSEWEADFSIGRAFWLLNHVDVFFGGNEALHTTEATSESLGQSPANIVLTDPAGAIVSKDVIEIPGAVYEEVDIDGDGDLDDLIFVPEDKIGEYVIEVIPESGTSDDEIFSLEVEENGESIVLAENAKFADVPAEGYIFESKLNCSDFDTDGDVDTVDFGTLVRHWLEQDCNYPGWCEGTDLNYNGFIDFIDFGLFADNWLWEKNPADIDINGYVDIADFIILANQWLQPPGSPSADIAPEIRDDFVDMLDLAVLAEHWLEGVSY